jgi:hypothetical protein
MTLPTINCIRKLKVGDWVIAKLLHEHPGYHRFDKQISFPVIGKDGYRHPIIGTTNKEFHEYHCFQSTQYLSFSRRENHPWNRQFPFYAYAVAGCKYVQIVRIIQGTPRFNATLFLP